MEKNMKTVKSYESRLLIKMFEKELKWKKNNKNFDILACFGVQ